MTMKICLTVFQCLFNGRWHKMWRWQEFMSFVVKMSLEGLLRINNKNKGVSGIFIQLNSNQTTKHKKNSNFSIKYNFHTNSIHFQSHVISFFFVFLISHFSLNFFFRKEWYNRKKIELDKKCHICVSSHIYYLYACMRKVKKHKAIITISSFDCMYSLP